MLAKKLTQDLEENQKILKELKSFVANGGADKVQEYCHDQRLDVDLAREIRIKEIHDQSDQVLKQIDAYEKERLKELEGSPGELSKNAAFVNKMEEFSSECKGYLHNEEMVETALVRLKVVQREAKLAIDDLNKLIFGDKKCQFDQEKVSENFSARLSISEARKSETKPKREYGFCSDFDQELRGHKGLVNSIVLLENGYVASGSDDGTIRIWNPDEGECIRTMKEREGGVTSLVLLKDGNLASGSSEGTVRVWDPIEGVLVFTLKKSSWPCAKRSLVLLNDGNIAISSDNEAGFDIFDPIEGEKIDGARSNTKYLAVLKDGRLVSANDNFRIRIWNY